MNVFIVDYIVLLTSFLLLLGIGIGTLACAIIPMTYDHLSTDYCDLACNSAFWLLVIGFGITFSALFAKTLRINIIMRNAKLCRRIKLTVRDTLYPVVIIFICKFYVCYFINRYHIKINSLTYCKRFVCLLH